jgi:hypothetical protein
MADITIPGWIKGVFKSARKNKTGIVWRRKVNVMKYCRHADLVHLCRRQGFLLLRNGEYYIIVSKRPGFRVFNS